MTDSNQMPSPSNTPTSTAPSTQTGSSYPTAPDLDRDDSRGGGSGISPVQIGASAAAAVTSALAASFFGVAGTLIGAAVGSIISTVAGALYSHYLGRAHERLKVTTEVVIQRIPSDVLTATPLRHLAPNGDSLNGTSPNAVPGRDSMRPIGEERGDESVDVPVSEAGDLLKVPADRAVLNGRSPGNSGSADGRNGSAGPGATWWKRPAVALGAVSMAGFLIALGVVLVSEQAIGHPLSGGTSGNSISKITGGDSDTSDSDTPKTTVTPTPTGSSDSSDENVAPTASATASQPTASAGSEATGEPEAPATDAPDTSSSAGAGAADAPAATAAP